MLAGQVPDADRDVRFLLDSGRAADAGVVFDRIAAEARVVDARWDPAVVLAHRAVLAWQLGRIPLALELAAEGWASLDVDQARGVTAAQAIGMLGYLLDTVGGHRASLGILMESVELARRAGDADTLAHCLSREAGSRLMWALRGPADSVRARLVAPLELYEEVLSLATPGQTRRRALAGSARALVGLGRVAEAEPLATRGLTASQEADDRYTLSLGNVAMAEVRWHQGRLCDARTFAARAVDAADSIRDARLLIWFAEILAAICRELGDPVCEANALRRAVSASRTKMRMLQEGLGQALEQRRVTLHAQEQEAAARQAADRDALTALLNRRGLGRQAAALLQQAVVNERKPWLALVDIDHFKDINDHAGHPAGDRALLEVARLLLRESRTDDVVSRWAGDEFVVLLVEHGDDASCSAGPTAAERIRRAVHDHDWRLVVGDTARPITVSIGVATGPPHLDSLFTAADHALYRAKRAGGNRVEVELAPLPER
ncbi:hypothetical protein GCM10025787_49080 [Saccharopolyspora rosea]